MESQNFNFHRGKPALLVLRGKTSSVCYSFSALQEIWQKANLFVVASQKQIKKGLYGPELFFANNLVLKKYGFWHFNVMTIWFNLSLLLLIKTLLQLINTNKE